MRILELDHEWMGGVPTDHGFTNFILQVLIHRDDTFVEEKAQHSGMNENNVV